MRAIRTEKFRFGERKKDTANRYHLLADFANIPTLYNIYRDKVVKYGFAIRYPLRQMIVCFGGVESRCVFSKTQRFIFFRACPVARLIFYGKTLRNTTHFPRLHTAEGMRPWKNACLSCVFLVKACLGTNQPRSVTSPYLFYIR